MRDAVIVLPVDEQVMGEARCVSCDASVARIKCAWWEGRLAECGPRPLPIMRPRPKQVDGMPTFGVTDEFRRSKGARVGSHGKRGVYAAWEEWQETGDRKWLERTFRIVRPVPLDRGPIYVYCPQCGTGQRVAPDVATMLESSQPQ